MYFNSPQWQQGQGGVVSPNVIQAPQQQQGGGLLGALGGLASILSGFGIGGGAMSGAANALGILGGGQQQPQQQVQNTQVQKDGSGMPEPPKEEPKPDEEKKNPEQTDIETQPISYMSPEQQILQALGLGLMPQMPSPYQGPYQNPPMMGQ